MELFTYSLPQAPACLIFQPTTKFAFLIFNSYTTRPKHEKLTSWGCFKNQRGYVWHSKNSHGSLMCMCETFTSMTFAGDEGFHVAWTVVTLYVERDCVPNLRSAIAQIVKQPTWNPVLVATLIVPQTLPKDSDLWVLSFEKSNDNGYTKRVTPP